jgi:hypothetical protein
VTDDVLLRGGPRDGRVIRRPDSAVAEVEIDGLIHRYVLTTRQDERDGTTYTVFNYDGEIDPSGAMPGAESPSGGRHHPVEVEDQ